MSLIATFYTDEPGQFFATLPGNNVGTLSAAAVRALGQEIRANPRSLGCPDCMEAV
jgi:hypothetical protein